MWLPLLDNVLFQGSNSFLEAMLEPFAKEVASATQDQVPLLQLILFENSFQIPARSPSQVALAISILGGAYMVCTPIQGQVYSVTPMRLSA